jgi:uncharacterized membrane protein YbhN (UPF0104 family)
VSTRVRWWRIVQVALAVLVVGLAVRYLASNWTAFRAQELQVVVRPGWLVLALGVVLATFALLIEAWRRVVLAQGERLTPIAAARIWLLASLGKYLPGKVWALAGAAVLAEAAGVRRGVAVTGALVLQALALGSGILLVAVLAPGSLAEQGSWLIGGTAVLGILALAGLLVLAIPSLLGRLRRLLPASWPVPESVPWPALLLGLGANLVAWAAYGGSLVFLARGLLPGAVPGWPLATAAFTLSYLAGLVAILAPAGVGPRESLLILLLAGPVGPKAAVGLAVASRILLTVAELGAAVPFLLARRGAPTPAPDRIRESR